MTEPGQPFGLGPQWAWGTTCCGKPVGCTNTSTQCLMRGHPWKRRHLTDQAVWRQEQMSADAAMVARAVHAQADQCERDAIACSGLQSAVLTIMADRFRQLGNAITFRLSAESDPEITGDDDTG